MERMEVGGRPPPEGEAAPERKVPTLSIQQPGGGDMHASRFLLGGRPDSARSAVSNASRMSEKKRSQLEMYLKKEDLKDALLTKIQAENPGAQNSRAAVQAVEEQVDDMIRNGTAEHTLQALKRDVHSSRTPANRSGINLKEVLADRPRTAGGNEVNKAVQDVYTSLNLQGIPRPEEAMSAPRGVSSHKDRGILPASRNSPEPRRPPAPGSSHFQKGQAVTHKKGAAADVAKYPPGTPSGGQWSHHGTASAMKKRQDTAPTYSKFGYDSEFMKTPQLVNYAPETYDSYVPSAATTDRSSSLMNHAPARMAAQHPSTPPAPPQHPPLAKQHEEPPLPTRNLPGRGMAKNAKKGGKAYSSDEVSSENSQNRGGWGFKTPPPTPPAGGYTPRSLDMGSSLDLASARSLDDVGLYEARTPEKAAGRSNAAVPRLGVGQAAKGKPSLRPSMKAGPGQDTRHELRRASFVNPNDPKDPTASLNSSINQNSSNLAGTPYSRRSGSSGALEYAEGYTPMSREAKEYKKGHTVLMPVFTMGPRKLTLEELIREKIREKSNAGPLFVYKSFRNIDVDQDGTINAPEFKRWLENYNIVLPVEHVHDILKLYDADGDGTLDYNEFIRRVMPQDFEKVTAEEMERSKKHNDEFFNSLKNRTSGGFKAQGAVESSEPAAGAASGRSRPAGQWEDILRRKIAEKSAAGPFYLLKVFKHFDKDNSGTMDHQEFKRVLAKFNVVPSREEFEEIISKYDGDNSGEIDFYEFVDRLLPSDEVAKKQEAEKMVGALKDRMEKRFASLREAFRAYDKDKSGTLDLQEIMNLIASENLATDQSAVLRLAQRLDADHSGEVTYDEFAKALSAEAEVMMQEKLDEFKPSDFNERFSGGTAHIPIEARAPAFQVPMSGERLEALLREKMQQRIKSGPGELRTAFKHFDTDGSGSISKEEFRTALRNFNINPHERDITELMRKYDINGTGEIDYYDFIYRMMPPDYPTVGQQLKTKMMDDMNVAFAEMREAFKSADNRRNNNYQTGLLPSHEVVRLAWEVGAGLSTDEMERIVGGMRQYAGGKVSYGDFLGQVKARVVALKGQKLARDVAAAPKGLLEALTDSNYPKAFDVRTPNFATKMTVDDLQDLIRQKVAARVKGGGGELRFAYKHFDKGGTGKVTYEAFERALRDFNIRLDSKALKKLLRRFDPAKAGHIDYHEFMNKVLPPYHLTMHEEGFLKPLRNAIPTDFAALRRVFRRLDRDDSGSLDVSELREVCRVVDVAIPDAELERMVKEAGGSMTFHDFQNMLKTKEVQRYASAGTNQHKRPYSPTPKVSNITYEEWERPATPDPDTYEPTPRGMPYAMGLDPHRPPTPTNGQRVAKEREEMAHYRMINGEANPLYLENDDSTDFSALSTFRSNLTNNSWGKPTPYKAPKAARPTTSSIKKRRGPAHRPSSARESRSRGAGEAAVRYARDEVPHGARSMAGSGSTRSGSAPLGIKKGAAAHYAGYGGYEGGDVDDYGRGGVWEAPPMHRQRPNSAWR